MGIVKKDGAILEKIVFSKEEIDKNERAFLDVQRDIKRAREALQDAYSRRRCRICGERHFSAGYCVTCYMRLRNGKDIGQKTVSGKNAKKKRTLEHLYFSVTGNTPGSNVSLDTWAEGLFALIEERYSQCALMYFKKGMTCKQIADALGLTNTVANRRVLRFVKLAKEITKR